MATSTPRDPAGPPPRGARLAAIRSINDDAIVVARDEDRARRARARWYWIVGSAATLTVLGMMALVIRELPRFRPQPSWSVTTPQPPLPARPGRPATPPPVVYPASNADPRQDIAALGHADPRVRRDATRRLGGYGGRNGYDPAAGNALLRALKDPDAGVRIAAAGSLATAFGPFTIAAFQQPKARLVAAGALLDALPDEDPRASEALLLALADVMPEPEDAGRVVPLLKDRDPAVRMAAAVLLVRIGEGEAAADALADAHDPKRGFPSRPALEHLKTMGRRRFSFQGHEPKEILDALVDGLTEPDRPTRRAAALGLADVARMDADSDHVGDALAATLRTSPDPARRRRARHLIRSLQVDTPAVRDALRAAAKDPDRPARDDALDLLRTLEKGK